MSKVAQLLRSRTRMRPWSDCLLTPLAPTPSSGPWGRRRCGVASCPEHPRIHPHSRLQQCELRFHEAQELIAQLQEGPRLDEVE